MTVFTAQPDTPPSSVWPLPVPDGTVAEIPARLRILLRSAPGTAERVIHRRSVYDPLLLAVLRAEIHLLRGRRSYACNSARVAMAVADGETPPFPTTQFRRRLLLAATVHADAACAAGTPDTLDACDRLMQLSDFCGDHRRRVLADMLHAVAVYQHLDCQVGRRLLARRRDRYRRDHGDTPLAGMLTRGQAAMDQYCTQPLPARPLIMTKLPPPPGGLLHPDLDHPPADYLWSRIHTHPGRHTCRASHTHTAPAVAGAERAPS